jgi:hypothetical protein
MTRRRFVTGIAITSALALVLLAAAWWRSGTEEDVIEEAPRAATARLPPLRSLQDKPVCPPDANPLRGDCLPAYLANLPPHPGPAGNATVEGVDSNRDGIRDDIEIFIAENYGYSERAVRALRSTGSAARKNCWPGRSARRPIHG